MTAVARTFFYIYDGPTEQELFDAHHESSEKTVELHCKQYLDKKYVCDTKIRARVDAIHAVNPGKYLVSIFALNSNMPELKVTFYYWAAARLGLMAIHEPAPGYP